MVLENVFKLRWIDKRQSYSFYLGIFYTIISFITSYILFSKVPGFVGVSCILFSVILVVPTVNKLFDLEEKIEVKKKKGIFVKHEHIMDFFLYYFIGIFITLLIISLFFPTFVLSKSQMYNSEQNQIQIKSNLPPPPTFSKTSIFIQILKINFIVLLVSFFLSIFYGSGAIFLITLNASIFASALGHVIRSNFNSGGILTSLSFAICNFGIIFFHMIPEVIAYLLAAMAGGVLSHAIIREKFASKNFHIVLIDSIILIFISIMVLITAAFLEANISKKLIDGGVCMNSKSVIILTFIVLLILFIFIEFGRKKYIKHLHLKF